MKATITFDASQIFISGQPEGSANPYAVSGNVSTYLISIVEQAIQQADASYNSPAYGSRLGWIASSVAELLGGTYAIEGDEPEETGVVY